MKEEGGMKKVSRFFPLLLLIPLVAAGLIYCGGGGDDDGECTETFISGTYNYSFSNNTSVTIQAGSDTITISFFSFNGTYNTSNDDLTIDTTSSISASAPTLFGSFTATVEQTLQIPADSDPTSGQIEVRAGADTITVTIVTTPSPGVNVSVNGGAERTSFTHGATLTPIP